MNQRHTVILVEAGRATFVCGCHADVLVELGAQVVLVEPIND